LLFLAGSYGGRVGTFCAAQAASKGVWGALISLLSIAIAASLARVRFDGPQAQRVRNEQAEVARRNANQALDQLATRVKDSADLVNNLKQVR
jgi:hypothetical protein